jgi:hypothetical protein
LKFKELRVREDVSHLVYGVSKDGHYTGTVTQTAALGVSARIAWHNISNITGLTDWLVDVKKTEFLSRTRKGLGASRKIFFADGGEVVEYVVGWKDERYLSYIATSGLPLDGYHATISITPRGKKSLITWTSFLISKGPDKKEFEEFLSFIDSFYKNSLKNLKEKLEKQHAPI